MSNNDKGGRQSFGKKNADFFEEKGEQNLLRPGRDDGFSAPRHDVVDIGTADNMYSNSDWKVGPMPRGGAPRYAPTGDGGTHQVKAASPTGKYAKRGGTGRGFGS